MVARKRTAHEKAVLRRLQNPKWEKLDPEKFPEASIDYWENETRVSAWRYQGIPMAYLFFVSKRSTEWGEILHLAMKKINQDKAIRDMKYLFLSEEPSYSEKIRMRQVIHEEACMGLEVFPRQQELVDQANLYHLWLMPKEFVFPFPEVWNQEELRFTKQVSVQKSMMIYGKATTITQWGEITYYLLENVQKQDLSWRIKQEFKNKVCGFDRMAVEVIPPKATCNPYGKNACLICFPKEFKLPFGLR